MAGGGNQGRWACSKRSPAASLRWRKSRSENSHALWFSPRDFVRFELSFAPFARALGPVSERLIPRSVEKGRPPAFQTSAVQEKERSGVNGERKNPLRDWAAGRERFEGKPDEP